MSGLLGRPVTLEDLSATLLLCVHQRMQVACETPKPGPCDPGRRWCAGRWDPALESISSANPTAASSSGETRFLDLKPGSVPDNLVARLHVYAGPLRTLFVMTDGVADDYFPADPDLARLYADLVLTALAPDVQQCGGSRGEVRRKSLGSTQQTDAWTAMLKFLSPKGR